MASQYPPDIRFTRFPDLPAELRCKIWALAATHPRIVCPLLYKKPRRTLSLSRNTRTVLYRSDTLAPAILHVSSESRIEGLKYYERLGCEGFDTYINWDHDYLTFVDGSFDFSLDWPRSGFTLKAAKCQQIALRSGGHIGNLKDYLPGLKRVVLICNPQCSELLTRNSRLQIPGPITQTPPRELGRSDQSFDMRLEDAFSGLSIEYTELLWGPHRRKKKRATHFLSL
jgi:hypothetical protein